MMALMVVEQMELGALAEIAQQAMEYAQQAKSVNTLRAYRSDWQDFTMWCARADLLAIPATPQTVALYLTTRAATCKPSTLQRRISAISQAHQAGGHESPTSAAMVRAAWAGIRRVKGTAQKGKAPAMTEQVRAMVGTLADTLLGARDRALLLLGFAGASRRSEIVGLDVADLAFNRDGLTVTVRRSKTDQEGRGIKKGIPYGSNPGTCPVRAVEAWLAAAGIGAGPVFRSVNRHGQLQAGRLSDKAVALVVKRCAEAAGLNPDDYAGHSLRAGLATSAAVNGASERSIMEQGGWRSVGMVRRYIRDGNLFRENAAASVGL